MTDKQTEAPPYRFAARVAFSSDGSELVAKIIGEIDHHSARRLRGEIDTEVFRQLPRTLTLDLSGVGFMDSAGLGLILGRLNLMTGRMGVLRLSGLNPPVARILALAGIERLPGLKLPEPDGAQPAGAI